MRGNKLVKYTDIIFGIPLLIFFGLFKIFRRKPQKYKKINKILIIKLSALGDTILLIPVIRTLRENYPDSKISMVITDINRAIAEKCNYINNTFEFKPQKFIKNPLELLEFIKKIRNEKFDLAIDADQWLRISALLSFFSRAKIRIGFKTKGQFKHFAFTDAILHKRDQHELECFFDLIGPLNLEIKNKSLEFNIEKNKLIEADVLLKSIGINKNEKFIII
ncbi:MAG: glycosyltransferase family 9 protein, partial [Endomicrobiia bacterium]